MRISDWSSDVCSSDLRAAVPHVCNRAGWWLVVLEHQVQGVSGSEHFVSESQWSWSDYRYWRCSRKSVTAGAEIRWHVDCRVHYTSIVRSEEHTSELQSLMRISYAVFCLKKQH